MGTKNAAILRLRTAISFRHHKYKDILLIHKHIIKKIIRLLFGIILNNMYICIRRVTYKRMKLYATVS